MRRGALLIAGRSALWVAALVCALAVAGEAGAQPPVPQPIVCDGTFAPSDSSGGDRFGSAVARPGSTSVVGAPGADVHGADSGAVYVLAGGGQQGPRLAPAHGEAGDRFGFSTATAGDRLVGGAPFRNQTGAESGAAYVFIRQGSSWLEDVPSLIPAGEAAGDRVGFAVAIAGDVAMAGAPGDDDRGGDAGAVYVFTRGGGGWVQAAKLTAGDGAGGDGFGSSLALAGGTLLVGAPGDDGSAGAVYAFTGSGGSWTQQAKLVASDRTGGSRFGAAVALSNDEAAVGAPGAAGTGAAYVFRRAGGAWSQEARLAAPVSGGDEWGGSVAIAGDLAAAGARFDDEGAGNSGAVYLFAREGSTWEPTFKLKTASPAGGAELGAALALAGSDLLAGAPGVGGNAGVVCSLAVPGGGPGPGPGPGEPQADLGITKTDGVASAVPGTPTTYTILATNGGPDAASGARVTDLFPAALGCTWTCAGTGGGTCTAAGNGDVSDLVNLPVGGAVTYTATCAIDPAATGTLTNTATATAPSGVTDPQSGNNSATDSDNLTPVADLEIEKSADGVAVPGSTLGYTLAVANLGPSTAAGAVVADAFPAGLTCSWTCSPGSGTGSACTAAGSGDLADAVTLPPGGSLDYAVTCQVSPNVLGSLVNTATVTPPPGVTDPTPANSSTVTVPVVPTADLSVTKSVAPPTVTAGGSVTFTVVAASAGPSPLAGVAVADAFPAGFACTWTCAASAGAACTAGPVSGDLADAATLPAGGTATYTAQCSIAASVQGTVCNTATVAAPSGATDLTAGNDTATACVEVTAVQADLRVMKNGPPQAVVGAPVGYTIVVSNAGPGAVQGAQVTDLVPIGVQGVTWSCSAAGGGSCPANGSGNIAVAVDLPPGATVTFDLNGIAVAPCGQVNTAAVDAPAGVVDPVFANNRSTVVTTVFPQSGVAACKRLLTGPHAPGSAVTYEVQLLNAGPLPFPDAPGDEFRDEIPQELEQVQASSSSGVVGVMGNLVTWNGAVQPLQIVTISIDGQVIGEVPVGTVVCNQGEVLAPAPLGGVLPTDDPGLPGPADPTCFAVASVLEIPTLAEWGLALLALLLAAAALRRLAGGY